MTVQPAEQVSAKPKRSRIENLEMVRKVWPWAFLVILIVLFSVASQAANNVAFLSPRSVQGILLYATQVLLIGLAETFVIIAAGIDLSTGWILGFASVVSNSKFLAMPFHLIQSFILLIRPTIAVPRDRTIFAQFTSFSKRPLLVGFDP